MGRECSTLGKKRTAYRVLVRKSERKKPLGRYKRELEENITTDSMG
jgi:hypothetical protein